MTLTVTVGGNLLGEVWRDRSSSNARTLQWTLDSAGREIEILPSGKDDENKPILIDHGKLASQYSVRTERCFSTPDAAAFWLLDVEESGGFSGPVVFKTLNGSRTKEFGIAEVTSAELEGNTVFVNWKLTIGRACS